MAGAIRESAYKKRRSAWRDVLFDLKGTDGDDIAKKRLELLELWRSDRWAYLTGRDVETEEDRDLKRKPRQILWTVDESTDESPIRPFPSHYEYLKDLTKELWEYRVVLVDKVRQMFITSLCAILMDHYAAFWEEREIFVSRVKEESAIKLINDKIRTVHNRKPLWLRQALPLSSQPRNIITYEESGSTITAVAQTFATSDARGPTGSLIYVDEAAYQEYFEEIYRAVMPMTARLWAVTTANIGNPGAHYFKRLVFEGRPGIEAPQEDDSEEIKVPIDAAAK